MHSDDCILDCAFACCLHSAFRTSLKVWIEFFTSPPLPPWIPSAPPPLAKTLKPSRAETPSRGSRKPSVRSLHSAPCSSLRFLRSARLRSLRSLAVHNLAVPIRSQIFGLKNHSQHHRPSPLYSARVGKLSCGWCHGIWGSLWYWRVCGFHNSGSWKIGLLQIWT